MRTRQVGYRNSDRLQSNTQKKMEPTIGNNNNTLASFRFKAMVNFPVRQGLDLPIDYGRAWIKRKL